MSSTITDKIFRGTFMIWWFFFIFSGCDQSPSRHQPDQACDAGRLWVQATGEKSGTVNLISFYRGVIYSNVSGITPLKNLSWTSNSFPMTKEYLYRFSLIHDQDNSQILLLLSIEIKHFTAMFLYQNMLWQP